MPSCRAIAQSRQSGEIRGTVTDDSGAVIGNVQVAITNVQTGVIQKLTTDSTGVYEAPFVQPGEYSISFEKTGFMTYIRNGIVLHVETIKVDAALKVGSVSESVTVTALQPLVETENAERGLTLTTQVVSDVPNVGRSWDELLGTLPGVNGGGGANATGQGIGVNGQTAYQSNWQIDGGIAMLGSSQNPDILQPPLDTIEEVDLSEANFGADRGTGLSVFNVTTKSGTNEFHGKVYEYVENDIFNAVNYFAQTKPALRWNEYGVAVGGPIKRHKAFFYGSFQNNPTSSPSTGFYSYPGSAMLGGDFSALCTGGFDTSGICTDGVQLYDPATTVAVGDNYVRQPFQGNIIPSGRLDSVAKAIQQYFPAPQTSAIANNYNISISTPIDTKWFTAKLDYDISPANRLTGSLMMVRATTQYTDPICSIDCITTPQHDTQGQVTDVWTISPQKVNEFRLSLSREHFIASEASEGKGWPAKLGLNNPAGDLFPIITIGGAFSTSIGADAAGFGGPAVDAETTYVPSDSFTWTKGKHIIKFGGEFERWMVNTAWPSANEGAFDFSGLFTQNPVDQAEAAPPAEGTGYADFLLGLSDSWYIDPMPVVGGRSWSAQAFAQDEYKITPNLTLTLGLRYIIQTGWSEVNNKLSGFQPDILNPGTNTDGALWFAGQLGHSAATDTVYDFFAPRAGFAWSPRNDTVIRGGFGIYNMIAGMSNYAGGMGQGWSPIGSLYSSDSLTPVLKLSDGPPAPIYPTAATRTADELNGAGINYPIFNSPVAYSEEYHLSVQHQLKGGFVVDAGYVGNRGLHLAYTRNIDQVPESKLGYNDTQYEAYPQYLAVSAAYYDGISAYNALQTSVKKQTSHGLLLTANYTWSKTLDEITNTGFVGGGTGFVEHGGDLQNQFKPRANYGPSTADIRHFFNGSFVYELPFGAGKRYLNQGGVLNEILGGWEISSLFQLHSGLPFTPHVSSANESGTLGAWRPNRLAKGTVPNPTLAEWFDPSAFAVPQQFTFGNSPRNFLYGPAWKNVNGALLKNFAIPRLGQKSKLQLKAEASNLFNHPNFGIPDAGINPASTTVGSITSAAGGRTMQFGASLTF